MKNTAEIVTDVIETGRKVAKRMTQRFPEAASFGEPVRQGDVYFTLLGAVPAGAVKIAVPMQLAEGDTQGSRHCLDSAKGVKAFRLANPNEFDGPVLQLAEDREITHPEHGHFVLGPGVYAVSFQRTQDALDRQRRVAD